MIKNILSIDMDYILEPCINLYNDIVNSSVCPENLWDTIENMRNVDKYLTYNEENLKFIFDVLENAIFKSGKNINISFALNHDEILKELTSESYKNDKFNLFNIDHHHDIYYSDSGKELVDKYSVANVGTWVWYLDKYNKLEFYNWIKNKNSSGMPKNFTPNCSGKSFIMTENDDIFKIDKWDYIFVCKSPHWTPRKFDYFFDILKKMCENFLNKKLDVDNNMFCPSGISKPLSY